MTNVNFMLMGSNFLEIQHILDNNDNHSYLR